MALAPQRILLIKPSSLGDIVHALPVLAALRGAWPSAQIAWLVATPFADLLRDHPMIDEVIAFDRARFGHVWRSPAAFAAFCRFVAALRRRRFDLVIDLQALFRSGFLAYASGARARIGPAAARELGGWFYTQSVNYPPDARHAVEKNCVVVAALGIATDPRAFPLPIDDAVRSAARAKLEACGVRDRFVAVIPGARWESKQTPVDRLAEIVDLAAGQVGIPMVLLGAKGDRALTDRLKAAMKSPVVDLVGQTSLRELAAVIAAADVVLCHDSGPMHVAAALETPIVALFGPTDESRTGPYAKDARVITNDISCRPCLRRVCPLGHQDCLSKIRIERVVQALREQVAAAGTAQGDSTATAADAASRLSSHG